MRVPVTMIFKITGLDCCDHDVYWEICQIYGKNENIWQNRRLRSHSCAKLACLASSTFRSGLGGCFLGFCGANIDLELNAAVNTPQNCQSTLHKGVFRGSISTLTLFNSKSSPYPVPRAKSDLGIPGRSLAIVPVRPTPLVARFRLSCPQLPINLSRTVQHAGPTGCPRNDVFAERNVEPSFAQHPKVLVGGQPA